MTRWPPGRTALFASRAERLALARVFGRPVEPTLTATQPGAAVLHHGPCARSHALGAAGRVAMRGVCSQPEASGAAPAREDRHAPRHEANARTHDGP